MVDYQPYFPVIKAAIDRKPQPGRFLLTGSANVMLLPKISESLEDVWKS